MFIFILLILLLGGLLYLVWKILAPKNLFFTFVKEGTAKIVLKGGAFHSVLYEWKGHAMDEEFNILQEEEVGLLERINSFGKIFGGFYFFGISPFFSISSIALRWSEIQRTEKSKRIDVPVWRDETNDFILLKPSVYWTKVSNVETGGDERIPISVEILVTMMVNNPYKFCFVAPPHPWEDVLARLDALIRAIIGGLELDQVLQLRKVGADTGDSLWDRIKDTDLIKNILPGWGVSIKEGGIEIRDIDIPDTYQEAAALKKKKEFEASARAQEIFGSIVSSMQELTGLSKEKVQKKLLKDENLFEKTKDMVLKKLAMESNSFIKVEVDGAEGPEKTFLNLLAMWQRLSQKEKKGLLRKPESKDEQIDRMVKEGKSFEEIFEEDTEDGEDQEDEK